jgi:hypothetical protein
VAKSDVRPHLTLCGDGGEGPFVVRGLVVHLAGGALGINERSASAVAAGQRRRVRGGAEEQQRPRRPGLAAALGTSCVRDCAGARAYLDVYAKYQQAHPRFDVNEPSCDKP